MSEELPDGWDIATLGSLVSKLVDGSHNPPQRQDQGLRMLSAKNVADGTIDFTNGRLIDSEAFEQEARRTRIEAGDVLLTIVGSIGRSAVVPEAHPPFTLQRSVAVIDTEALKPEFLSCQLRSPMCQRYFSDFARGTAQKGIYLGSLAELPIVIAPIAEQVRIAAKIDELFSQIDEGERALERVRKLVERYRQSVLKAAVTGELTREWREQHTGELESGEALLTRILEARRQAWEQSRAARAKNKSKPPIYRSPVLPAVEGLPELPETWSWASPVQLEALVPNALTIGPFGSNLKVSDYETSGVPLIFVRNIRMQEFAAHKSKFVNVAKALELSSHTARGGDVLITKMGDPPGDACTYPLGAPDAVITSDCLKWTLHPALPKADYFTSFINSRVGQNQISEITRGVAQQKVSLDRFRQIAIAVPGPEEQEEIVERLRVELQRIGVIENLVTMELRRGGALRQSILKAAFSGQLVPQDPDDEPASVLLERIAAERVAAPKRASGKRAGAKARKSKGRA